MQLELGRNYVTGGGESITVTAEMDSENATSEFFGHNGRIYYSNGLCTTDHNSPEHHLVKLTLAERFVDKATELMPHHEELRELVLAIDDAEHIDEIMFHNSEYIGGMAAVILSLLERESA